MAHACAGDEYGVIYGVAGRATDYSEWDPLASKVM